MNALATMDTDAATHPTIARLYFWGISPYCYKVRMAAAYKGLRFEEVICSGPQLMEARRQTGMRKVPVVEASDGWVTDSTRILAWLDERHPEPSLYPEAGRDRAECALLEDWADEALGAAAETWIWLGDGRLNRLNAICADEQTHRPSAWFMRLIRPFQRRSWHGRAEKFGGVEATRALLGSQLDLLEKRMDGQQWLFGGRPTAADFAVAGQLVNLLRFDAASDLDARPGVSAMVRRAASMLPERDAFAS